MLSELFNTTDAEAAAFFADARAALAPIPAATKHTPAVPLILADLTGMPDGPAPNADLVSDWSLASFDAYFRNSARHAANTLARKATETEASGRWMERWHKSRADAVVSLLATAESAAPDEDRPWHAARLDAYSDAHGLRGWYRTTSSGKHCVQVNYLRRPDDGDRGRYFVSPEYRLSGGLRRSSVIDRDTGRVAYRAINQRIAQQWIDEREAT